ncbi:ChrR family anti-sigma-E factor [Devosia neptuniae]|jgi:putative transcriptional regulator|uniref:ChrR family anti-sigma-E factor n=1 Tax=Devosia TaxID=46913 RepID=UPI0022AECFFB|nr:ChrR family anti-sigma-E factor [Devosia neptuniae]MCZ4346232.1 ChrR family anti-sigma-E factor [Devosia neptuniae]|tara:strand:+ start:2503 stop:3159 length:657 start_codon:yes stop_codon:yes gene_type:complete
MTVNHHPDITTLMAFSAGTLDEPYAAVIATHLAMSEGGRESLRHINTIGGALLNVEPKAEMAKGSLDRLMDALGDDDRIDVTPHDERQSDDAVPLPLQRYLPKGLDGVRWKWTGPGVATADLAWGSDGRSRLMLLRVGAGRPVPEHGHGGQELTLILSGAYRDRFGVFAKGDIADHDEDVEHQPIAEPGDDCICLVAVDAKLTFRGRLMRALQPLFGL